MDTFVVMSNHAHAIIDLNPAKSIPVLDGNPGFTIISFETMTNTTELPIISKTILLIGGRINILNDVCRDAQLCISTNTKHKTHSPHCPLNQRLSQIELRNLRLIDPTLYLVTNRKKLINLGDNAVLDSKGWDLGKCK